MAEYEQIKTIITEALREFKAKISLNTGYYRELAPEGQYLIEKRRALDILGTTAYTDLLNDLNAVGLKELFARVFNVARVYDLGTYQGMVRMIPDVLALDPDNEGDADAAPRKITLHQNHYVQGPAPNNSRIHRSIYKEINAYAENYTSLSDEQTDTSGSAETRPSPGANTLEQRVRQAPSNSGPCLVYSYFGIAQTYAESIGAERTLLTQAEIEAMLSDPSIYNAVSQDAQNGRVVIERALRVLGIETTNLNIRVSDREDLPPDPNAFATVRHVEARNVVGVPGHWQEGTNTGELRWDPIDGTESNRESFGIRNVYIDEVRR
jgi:hypothetical protein